MLSDLVDRTKKLGLTVDKYLQSTGKNTESIRKEYEEQSRRSLTLEFALEQISDEEKITVTDDDIQNALKEVKDETERKNLEAQKYYLTSLLRRQKTLSHIMAI